MDGHYIALSNQTAALQNQNFSGRHFEQMSNRRNHTILNDWLSFLDIELIPHSPIVDDWP